MDWLTKLFVMNIHDFLKNKECRPKLNKNAIRQCIKFIDELIEFLQKDVALDIKNSSLYILVDHKNDDCIIKLIDMSYVETYVDNNRRDDGFIFGLKSLSESLQNILHNIRIQCSQCEHVNSRGVFKCAKCDKWNGVNVIP